MQGDLNFSVDLSNAKLCLVKALDLLDSRGSFWYCNENIWAINILTTLDVSSAMTLIHEWTHRIYVKYSHHDYLESPIYGEALA